LRKQPADQNTAGDGLEEARFAPRRNRRRPRIKAAIGRPLKTDEDVLQRNAVRQHRLDRREVVDARSRHHISEAAGDQLGA
jgi:hypothetical protein